MENNEFKLRKKNQFISKPLFIQSFKANWILWLVLTLGCTFVFSAVILALNSTQIFVTIDMAEVSAYVGDEGLNWLQIMGFLEQLGFTLTRIEAMSTIDLNIVFSDLVYKIAGVLLPMIYGLLTANALVVNQVDDGSMAYILSTPTNRKTVVRTQFLYLLCGLISMFIIITIGAVISEGVADKICAAGKDGYVSKFVPLKTILYCFSTFCSIFALAGISFGASCFFNKSKYATAIGGGIAVVSFLACVMGFVGHKAFVAFGIGVESMQIFNYFSIFTLINTESIGQFVSFINGNPDAVLSFTWLINIGIMLAIGLLCSLIGAIKFVKKDLPL